MRVRVKKESMRDETDRWRGRGRERKKSTEIEATSVENRPNNLLLQVKEQIPQVIC